MRSQRGAGERGPKSEGGRPKVWPSRVHRSRLRASLGSRIRPRPRDPAPSHQKAPAAPVLVEIRALRGVLRGISRAPPLGARAHLSDLPDRPSMLAHGAGPVRPPKPGARLPTPTSPSHPRARPAPRKARNFCLADALPHPSPQHNLRDLVRKQGGPQLQTHINNNLTAMCLRSELANTNARTPRHFVVLPPCPLPRAYTRRIPWGYKSRPRPRPNQ